MPPSRATFIEKHYRTDESEPIGNAGGCLRARQSFTYEAEVSDPALLISVDGVLNHQEGQYFVESIRATKIDNETPVATETLKRAPIAPLLFRGAVKSAFIEVRTIPEKLVDEGWPESSWEAERPTHQNLEVLSLLYRIALLVGSPASNYVADVLHIPKRRVTDWTMRARASHLLPPATGRRPRGGTSERYVQASSREHGSWSLLAERSEELKPLVDVFPRFLDQLDLGDK